MPIHPHSAEPDGVGGCLRCPLPPSNAKVHQATATPIRLPHYTPAAESLDGPRTTTIAAGAAERVRGQLRVAILAHLATHGPKTCAELEDALAGRHRQSSVSSAVNALTRDNLLEAATDGTGQTVTRPTRSGRPAIAWTVTALGRLAATAAS